MNETDDKNWDIIPEQSKVKAFEAKQMPYQETRIGKEQGKEAVFGVIRFRQEQFENASLQKYLGCQKPEPVSLVKYSNNFRNIIKLMVLVNTFVTDYPRKTLPEKASEEQRKSINEHNLRRAEYWKMILDEANSLDALYNYIAHIRNERR